MNIAAAIVAARKTYEALTKKGQKKNNVTVNTKKKKSPKKKPEREKIKVSIDPLNLG